MLEKSKVPGPDRYNISSTLLGANKDAFSCACSKIYLAPPNPRNSRLQMKEEKIKRIRDKLKTDIDDPGPGHYEVPGSFGIQQIPIKPVIKLKRRDSVPRQAHRKNRQPSHHRQASTLLNSTVRADNFVNIDGFANRGFRRLVPQDIGRACTRMAGPASRNAP